MAYSLIIRQTARVDTVSFIDEIDGEQKIVSRISRAGLSREACREVNRIAVDWWKKKNGY